MVIIYNLLFYCCRRILDLLDVLGCVNMYIVVFFPLFLKNNFISHTQTSLEVMKCSCFLDLITYFQFFFAQYAIPKLSTNKFMYRVFYFRTFLWCLKLNTFLQFSIIWFFCCRILFWVNRWLRYIIKMFKMSDPLQTKPETWARSSDEPLD